MKAVAAHALIPQLFWQGKGVVHLGHVGMEGRIEARDLCHLREGSAKTANALQVVRLVQRRQGVKARQALQHLVGDAHAGGVFPAAMHDPVRHGLDALRRSQLLHQPAQAL